jgi:ribose transport system substrate-binding protein
MFHKRSRVARLVVGLAGLAIIVGACSSGSSAAPSGAAKTWKIGYSNPGGVGNGFREEQVCTAKAEALASGQVSEMTTIHRDTDAAGQLADIRSLIAKGVDAIVFNPVDPDSLTPALQEAQAAGIKTISVDQYVNDAKTYNLYNNQTEYAYLGAKWLFEQLKGTGNVYYMRGIAGASADSDRDIGFKKALAEYPNIKVVPTNDGVFTKWNSAEATKLMDAFIASGEYDKIQGIWTSGMDGEIVESIKAANKPFVPIVGADRGVFVKPLLDPTNYEGLTGAAVTNTAAVGGAGVALALKLLNGETVQTDSSAPKPNTVLLVPVLADNLADAGKATLKSWLVDGLNEAWPLGLQIEGWTHYTPQQAIDCKGPGGN